MPHDLVASLTIVPLLSNAPLAQNELVSTSRAFTVLVSRFHRAPQAEWLLIWSGSSEARSKKTTSVGETTMASSATMPDVSFLRLNSHFGAAGADGAPTALATKRLAREKSECFILEVEGLLTMLETLCPWNRQRA